MSQPERYVACSSLPVSIEEAFAYHERPGALRRMIPPWESVAIQRSDDSLEVGSRVVMKAKIFGVPMRWVAEHTEYDPPSLFTDTQVSGPFAYWRHRHEFKEMGRYTSLRDCIDYRLPLGPIGRFFGGGKARRMLESMLAYRHRLVRDDLTLQADRPLDPICVALSGSSGMVGSQLQSLLTLLGHRVRRIVRSPSEDPADIAVWSNESEWSKLEEIDAVVHLAGKPIAAERWSEEVKRQIHDSRVDPTRQLCEILAGLNKKPSVLICASASGIYGDRGDELLSEDSDPGDDFLAEVAGDWERACQPAVEAGIRVVNARFGMVLSPQGGALPKMLLPAKLAGGSLGDGKQWCSWIALDDALGALYHTITDPSLSGPVNFVAPQPVTNRDFTNTLAGVLHRPALIDAPAFMLRTALGELADGLLLCSARVEPNRLTKANYRFRFTELDDLLRYALGVERLESVE